MTTVARRGYVATGPQPTGPRPGSLAAKLQAERACRLCERTNRKLTRHRLVPGRLGGPYVAPNVVPLCRSCHDAVEASVETRRMLRPRLWPEEIAYVIRHLRHVWLEREYPIPAARSKD